MKNLEDLDLAQYRESYNVEAIDRDFAVLDDISKLPFFEYPTKISVAVLTICLKGTFEVSIDLKRHVVTENQTIIIRPDQILQYHHISDDFSGRFIVMSQNFLDTISINIGDKYPLWFFLKNTPVSQCSQQEIEIFKDYYTMLDKTVRMKDNPNRKGTVKYLLLAFHNVLKNNPQRRQDAQNAMYSRKNEIFESFYKFIQQHHKKHRTVGFYADKLCLTPKYLTTVIREVSGTTAHDWINEYVILSAKALLKSTVMTIQEISNELSFANQSFFGKYFKQYVGMTPMEYRKSN